MTDAYLKLYNEELNRVNDAAWNDGSAMINPDVEGGEHLRETRDAVDAELKAQGEEDPSVRSAAGTFAANLVDSVMFGWSDEFRARAMSVLPDVDYESYIEQLETVKKMSNQANPNAAIAGEVSGFLVGGGAKLGVGVARFIGGRALAGVGKKLIGMSAVKAATVATQQLGKTRAANLFVKTITGAEKISSAPIVALSSGISKMVPQGTNVVSKALFDVLPTAMIAGGAAGAGYAAPGERLTGALEGAQTGALVGLAGTGIIGGASLAARGVGSVVDKSRGALTFDPAAKAKIVAESGEEAAAKTLTTLAERAGATTDDVEKGLQSLARGASPLDEGTTGLANIADDLTKSTEVTNLTNPVGETRLASQADEVLDTVQSSLGKTVAEKEVLEKITSKELGPRYDKVNPVQVSPETDLALRAANPDNVSGNALPDTIKGLEFSGQDIAPQLAKDLKLKPFVLDDIGNARPIGTNAKGEIDVTDEVIKGIQAAKDPNKYLYESVVRREINNNPDGFLNEIGYQTDGTIDPSQMSLKFSQKLVNSFTQAKEGIKKFTLKLADEGKDLKSKIKDVEQQLRQVTDDKNKAVRAATTVKAKDAARLKFKRRIGNYERKLERLNDKRYDIAETLNKSRKNIRTLSSTANKAIKSVSNRQVVRTIGDTDKVYREAGATLKPNQGSGAKAKAGDEGALVREDMRRIMAAAPKEEAEAFTELLKIKADSAKATKANKAIAKIHSRIQETFQSPGADVNKVAKLTKNETKALTNVTSRAAVRGMQEGLRKLNKKVQATKLYLEQGKGNVINKYTIPDTGWLGQGVNFIIRYSGLGKVPPALQREMASAIFGLDNAKAQRILSRTKVLIESRAEYNAMKKEISALLGKAGGSTQED